MNQYLSLKDHVYRYISDGISSGAMSPGDKINEQQVCEELKISRTPVREALMQLAADGYLDIFPRRGFRVKLLDIGRVRQLYEIVGTLDGRAAALCIEQDIRMEDALEEMSALAEEMDASIQDRDGKRYYELQLAFHDVYLQRCPNTELTALLKRVRNSFVRKYYLFENPGNEWEVIHGTNMEHYGIIRLFREKKADALEHYIRDVHWNSRHAKFDAFPEP